MPITFPPTTGSYADDCEAGNLVFNEALATMSDGDLQPIVQLLNDMTHLSPGHRVGFNQALVSALRDLAY